MQDSGKERRLDQHISQRFAPKYENACNSCRMANTCQDIANKLIGIREKLQLQEVQVVRFHTLCLSLNENDFHFPYSPIPCGYVTASPEKLLIILQDQEEIIELQNAG